jgi:nicotinate phosphoribosyltransferase
MNTRESLYLSQGLDYYKATMGQVEFDKHPDAIVTFELKNRGANKLSEYVTTDQLRTRLDGLSDGWTPEEIAYLASLTNQDGGPRFTAEYLDFLVDNPLPSVEVDIDNDGELAVTTTGAWPLVTFWETVVMSELNELYFTNKLAAEGSTLDTLYTEGDRRLSDKIARLSDRPDIKFSDFGTRRRFSYEWQKHVIERVARELPVNFMGTSNIFLAHELGLKPIGTYAHEMPMVYGALEQMNGNDPLDGHHKMLRDWEEVHRGDLSTALTDTWTSEYFFTDFTPAQAEAWGGLRHDSGDPFEFGERVIAFYENLGIDPMEHTIVYSDGLDIDMIVALADRFKNRIKLVFGWGTTLTNDLGVRANNFVMKAAEVARPEASTSPQGTVKLSDTEGKHMGSIQDVELYKQNVARATAMGARAYQLSVAERTEARELVVA